MNLVETPNFARLLSLERLELEGCSSLVEVDESIGHLEKLVFLNLVNCNNLRDLPNSICNLRSLETMNFRGCLKVCSLPEHLGNLEALRKLVISGSAIKELPTSIGLLKNLGHLSIAELKEALPIPSKSWFSFFSSWVSDSPKRATSSSLVLPSTFIHLTSLRKLNLCDRNFLDNEISIDFRNFKFLSSLNLGGNNFCNLPAGISNHPKLVNLKLNDCKNLQSLEELPPNLWMLEAKQCTSIERHPSLADIVIV
ncbi:hypothetical protein COLO4_20242 [Corchorus olitorius]|uniref:Disease resistance protein RPS4B/Roq1-like leucine-rich repeats domain-containing protein n=1 Tax=Corchorus olitorius TaxID=93759 RepID=A0A1R3J0Z8_9ROSI|nr:hypothetical protein COLO4_20242 [Corchorus olitorius]